MSEEIAVRLYEEAFKGPRDPRSDAYKKGVLDAIRFRLKVIATLNDACPYVPGTAENDAWHSGLYEGHSLGKSYLESISFGTPESAAWAEKLIAEKTKAEILAKHRK